MRKEKKLFMNPVSSVNLHQQVLCASTGLKCEGVCRDLHLQNNRTGICIGAYNPPKSKFKRVEKWDQVRELDELQELQELQFSPFLLS